MGRALLIVDPQYDFINGSLPVCGAAEAMDALAAYIGHNTYDIHIVTLDQHPQNHCSFRENGGTWPLHCVEGHAGAEIWKPVQMALAARTARTLFLPKGTEPGKEEYSIWQSGRSAPRLKEILKSEKIDQIDICGIAGDICVLNTLKDGINLYGASLFHVLFQFCPSIDGGSALADYCRKEKLCAR